MELQTRWLEQFAEALGQAVAGGELPRDTDIDQLVFEITAMLVRANFTWIVTGEGEYGDELLRSLDVDTLVLTGIVTHGGVEATARDALIRDFSVVILEDGVAAFDEQLHLASLRGMGLYLTVMDSADYLRALQQSAAS